MARRFTVRVFAVVLIGVLSVSSVARVGARQETGAPSYSAVDLGAIKDYADTSAFAINAKGVIVGQGYDPIKFTSRAFIYRSSKIRALVKGEKGTSAAQDINASGQIVGFSAENGPPSAVLWDGDEATKLGDFADGNGSSFATAINDDGVVVGWATDSSGEPMLPFVWNDGELTQLPLLGDGESGLAININAAGVIVGYSTSKPAATGAQHAVSWVDGKVTELGTIGGDFSQALGINAAGVIVGRSTTDAGQQVRGAGSHAIRWDGPDVIDLGTLEDGEISVAAAINADGLIVGRSSTVPGETGAENHAFVWRDGDLLDLNDLVEGGSAAVLDNAYDINDAGQILAMGHVDGIEHAYVLTPIES
jgi:probable HAF family extracellular repeat protein